MPADGGLLPLLALGLGALGSAATREKPLAVSPGLLDRGIKILFFFVSLALILLASLMLYAYTTSAQAAEPPESWCYAPGGVVDRCGQAQPTAVRDAVGRWVLGVPEPALPDYGWYREQWPEKTHYQRYSDDPVINTNTGRAVYTVTTPLPEDRHGYIRVDVMGSDPLEYHWYQKRYAQKKLSCETYGETPDLDPEALTATYPVVPCSEEEQEAQLLARFEQSLRSKLMGLLVLAGTGKALPPGSVEADTLQFLGLMRASELQRVLVTKALTPDAVTAEELAAAIAELDQLAQIPDSVRDLYAQEAAIVNYVKVALEPEEYADYLGPDRSTRWPDGPWFD